MANNPNPLYSRAMVEEVLRLTNIIDVVTPHTELRPQGNGEWSGLCPFHTEKTPSFYVNEAKGVYLCYGCQKKGNSITFLRDMEGLSFSEAMNRLRRGAGLPELVQSNRQMEDISAVYRSLERSKLDEDRSWDSDPIIERWPLGEVMFWVAETGRFVLDTNGPDAFDEVERVYQIFDDAIRDEDWGKISSMKTNMASNFKGVGE